MRRFLLSVITALAQTTAPPVNLPDTEMRTLTSTKIGQRYELLISLPGGYAKSTQSYPVLYVLDGWHFPFLAFLQNNNIYSQRMRPVIMVNISHGPTPAAMALRARDFTPTKTPREANSGGAPVGDDHDNTDSTTAFAKLLDELKPPKLDYRFTLYHGENHNSVRLASFPAGLYWIYRPDK